MRKIMALCLLALVLFSGCGRNDDTEAEALPFSGGTGTEADPYRISSEEDLRQMQQLINGEDTHADYAGAWYTLTADIALNDKKEWVPIHTFSGVFSGQGHTISGMHIRHTDPLLGESPSQSGFVGTLKGTVENLSFRDCSIVSLKDNGEVGTVAGRASGGRILGCQAADTVTVTGAYHVGGICGNLNQGSVLDSCTSAATVTGSENIAIAGGIAGRAACHVTGCTNTGPVSSVGDAAGIACTSTAGVSDCTNTGVITAEGYAGGIVVSFDDGALNSSANKTDVELKGCSNSGAVTSTGDPAGGIAAGCRTGSIVDCVNSGAVSSPEEAGGIFAYFQPSMFGTPCAYFRVVGCTNTGDVTNTDRSSLYPVGGICGRIYDCPTDLFFENCENLGAVTSGTSAGGIVGDGQFRTLTLSGCTNTGAVEGAESVGGLVGQIRPMNTELEETILFEAANCRNTGDVYGARSQGYDGGIYVGGILGYVNELTADRPFTDVLFEDCENTGRLTGSRESRAVYTHGHCGSLAAN